MLGFASVDISKGLGSAEYSALLVAVPPDRRRVIEGMGSRTAAANRLAGEVLSRFMLSEQTGERCADIAITTGEHGKPRPAEHPGLHFSVSHSGGLVVCAISCAPVGADIERISRADIRVAKRFFHPDEYARLLESPDLETAFASIWTKKESFVKRDGLGAARHFPSFSVFGADAVFIPADIQPGFVCNVCTDGETGRSGKIDAARRLNAWELACLAGQLA